MKTRILSLLCALVLVLGMIPSAMALECETTRTADTLATLGLVQGNGTDYALDAPATRAHAAVLLVRLAGAEQAAKNDLWISGFRDVPAWAHTPITYAAHQGWITGVTTLDFKPDNTLTANAWCTMLLRMLGDSDKAGDFTVGEAAVFARRIGLVSQSYEGTMTRGDVFQTMYDALFFTYKDANETVMDRLVKRGICSRTAANALGLLDKRLTARQIADRHMAAVFCLDTYESIDYFYAEQPAGNATGFFITADGLAVTNYHSIEGRPFAMATTVTGETYPVEEVIYYDPAIDIAVIRVSRTSTEKKTTSAFACLELTGTGEIRNGDVVYAISNPLGLGLAISSGIIGSTAHDVERYQLPCVVNSADISQGSSGGALLNEFGKVIAITSGAYTYGNNMYLAVPVNPAMEADLSVEGMTLEEVMKAEAEKAEE